MPAILSAKEVETFRLDRLDAKMGVPEAEKTTVTIKQAAVGENSKRADLFSEVKTQIDLTKNTETRIINLPFYGLILEEIFLTLVGCNLQVMNKDKEPVDLFKFSNGPNGPFLDMTRNQFDAAIGGVDDDVLSEIHEKVLEVNFHWRWATSNLDLGEES